MMGKHKRDGKFCLSFGRFYAAYLPVDTDFEHNVIFQRLRAQDEAVVEVDEVPDGRGSVVEQRHSIAAPSMKLHHTRRNHFE